MPGEQRLESRQVCSGPGRPTIGLLADWFHAKYSTLMWLGVADAARERGVNAICFPSYLGQFGANFQVLYTGTFLSILPLALLYILFRLWFIQGIMAGALKG